MRSLRFVLAALAIGAWAAGPLTGASAAALLAPSYQSSEPAKGAMMDEPPSDVTVTFSEPLDQSSWMKVLDECDRVISTGAATIQLNEMTVEIGNNTPSGMYEVVYKAVGVAGATGTSGSSFEFMVHNGKPCKGGHGSHHPPDHDKDKKKHKDHDGDHDDDQRGGGHDDHDSGGSTHSGHTGMTGMSGSTTHSGHTMTPAGGGHGRGHGKGHGQHGNGGNPPGGGDGETPPLATGDTIPASADAEAVLVGLGLALAVGVLGGWLLRMSNSLSEA